ncbi:hypothetical protein DDB_G0273299 [Dictyostelium discoideum AX4]|uniref:THH1/TOM1/TOM3 domain-containing protein n=1 Tax=Dictyostelium discoideum TaxID=44689 RepID=Q557Z5_DICDI|nr:hypothetical protein DDB_G0273299 [Dictyostelium discoideum AX4]EAL70867.1 hypothetical protein DDB_G0273299 [Dictyostelium discoideum AX4]|eukprot:XP_644752.1 hypothetical protein DDB_G0273299 [Dictyostelium discoideum AX4]
MESTEYFTGSDSFDKLTYSFMGLRLIAYTYFFIICFYQAFLEILKMIKKQSKTTTRFFVFFFQSLFCILRTIQTAFFYDNHQLGTAAIFLAWVFIQHYWLLIMYKFFISEEVRLNRAKPINYSTFIFALVIIIYQFTVSSITLRKNIETAESVGFLILLLIYASIVSFNGYYLLRHLKKHKKSTPFSHFDIMILKTKILLSTVIFVAVTIIIQELIFNMYYTDTYETPRQYLKLFIVGVIEFFQLLVVMLVLSDGKWKVYVLFKSIKTHNDSSSEMENSNSNSKGKKSSTFDLGYSGNTNSNFNTLEISIEIENSNKSSTSFSNSKSDLINSSLKDPS